MPDAETLKLLTQWGPVAFLALVGMGFAFYIFKAYQKTINNHIAHSTEALYKVAGAVDNNTEAIKDLKEEIRSRRL